MNRVPGDEDEDEDLPETVRPSVHPVKTVAWILLILVVSMVFYCLELWMTPTPP